MKIRFICKNCGSVNEKEKDVLTDPDYSQEDWLCDLPVGFEWILPVGKITRLWAARSMSPVWGQFHPRGVS